MNRLSDIIEMGGNLYEEAWNNGRREALKEVQGGKYEKLEETNRHLRAQIDNYEKIRLKKDEEIHQLESDLQEIKEQYQRIDEDKARLCSDNIHIGVKATEYYDTLEIAKGEIHQLKEQLKRLTDDKRKLTQNLDHVIEENNDLELTIGRLKATIEKAENENANKQARLDSYQKVWVSQGKEINQLTEQVHQLEAKIVEQAEALDAYREPTPTACPFCGGRPDVVAINKERWVVVCHSDTCAVNPETDAFDTIEEAVSAWNHRAGGLTCDWR